VSVSGGACSDFVQHTCTCSETRTPWRTPKSSPAARLQSPCCRTGLSRSQRTCRRRCCSPPFPCSVLTVSATPCSFAERKVSRIARTEDGCEAKQPRAEACLHAERLAVPSSIKTQPVQVQSTAQDHATLRFKYLASSLELSAGASAVRLPEARAHTVLL